MERLRDGGEPVLGKPVKGRIRLRFANPAPADPEVEFDRFFPIAAVKSRTTVAWMQCRAYDSRDSNQSMRRGPVASDAEIVTRGWEAVARGDWDTLVADYIDDMIFVMPGQADVLKGKAAFRGALENIGAALPPGFDITSMHQIGDNGEVVSIVEWKSDKVPGGSQLAVLFKLTEGKVYEERWFVDTEQWKAAF